MDSSDLTQAVLRAGHLISLVSLFGTLVFLAAVAPAAFAKDGAGDVPTRGRLVRLARGSAALALATGLAWLVIQAALIAEASSVIETLDALPIVALHTQFGCFVLMRPALLMAVLPLVRPTFAAHCSASA